MRKAYLLVGRILTPFALIGLKIFTVITDRQRVRVLVINEHDELLLLRGVISHRQWTLPGGGVNRNESVLAAARRELHEETGISVPETAFTYMRTLQKSEAALPFRAPLFCVHVAKEELPLKMANRHEIAEVGWFDRNNLPTPLSKIALLALQELYV